MTIATREDVARRSRLVKASPRLCKAEFAEYGSRGCFASSTRSHVVARITAFVGVFQSFLFVVGISETHGRDVEVEGSCVAGVRETSLEEL